MDTKLTYDSLSLQEKKYMEALSKIYASQHKNVPEGLILAKVLPGFRDAPLKRKKVFKSLEKKGLIFNYGARTDVWALTQDGLHVSIYIRENVLHRLDGIKIQRHG
jgi:hypothetical protein